MWLRFIFTFVLFVCTHLGVQAQSPSIDAKDDWLNLLATFDENREKNAARFAVVFEYELLHSLKDVPEGLYGRSDRFVIARSGEKSLFAVSRQENADSFNRVTWLEVKFQAKGDSFFFVGSYPDLQSLKTLSSDKDRYERRYQMFPEFDPMVLPICWFMPWMRGEAKSDWVDKLAISKVDCSIADTDRNRIRVRNTSEITGTEYRRNKKSGLIQEVVVQLFKEPTVTWEKAPIYSITQTEWGRHKDAFLPSRSRWKGYPSRLWSKDPNQEFTVEQRFTWLDVDQFENLLSPDKLLAFLKTTPPDSGIFDELKKMKIDLEKP